MMSFNAKIKSDLCHTKNPPKDCCKAAVLYGILLFCTKISCRQIRILSDHHDVIALICAYFLDVVGVDISELVLQGKKERIVIEDEAVIQKAFKVLPLNYGGDEMRLDSRFIRKGCCTQSFLKGVFLICGAVSDPRSDYHLEFSCTSQPLCDDLMYLLFHLNFEPKITRRRNTNVVYFKDSEFIEDILNFIGATGAALELMEIKIERDVRNKINRVVNCETANISKTVNAAAMQIEAIKKISETIGLENLPEGLKIVAAARLNNPDSSLLELCGMVEGNLSRSGINHRMHRLMQIAKEL